MQKRKTDNPHSKSVIKCECGAEILFVSDLTAMRRIIEGHAETHRNLERDCSKTDAANEGEAELEVIRIREKLIAEAMKLANK